MTDPTLKNRELRSNSQATPISEKRTYSMCVSVYQEIFPLAHMDKRVRVTTRRHYGPLFPYGSLLPKWTDDVGRYLMDLGFPLVGVGSLSLCFLINDTCVIKVPKIGEHECSAGDESSYRRCPACGHNMERGRDVGMCSGYPTAFARTELMYIDLPNAYGRHHRVYVQERLQGPFERHGMSPDILAKQPNAEALREITRNNPDVKQWAKRMDGTIVYYDYS